MTRHRFMLVAILAATSSSAQSQVPQAVLPPPGRLVDLVGYRMHLLCSGAAASDRPTEVLSAGGGDFAVDWSLVQRPLSDSIRVCSYDRPGYGWSDPGPEPRTFRQEAFEVHAGPQHRDYGRDVTEARVACLAYAFVEGEPLTPAVVTGEVAA